MRRIDQGWQYAVYDLGNGRVRKVSASRFSQYRFIRAAEKRKGRAHGPLAVLRHMRNVDRRRAEANAYVRTILPFSGGALFGNPVFLAGETYEQDLVQVLGPVLAVAPLEEGCRLIGEYARLVTTLWRYGCAEMMYNFTDNVGVAADGAVIQIDFGELVFDRTAVARDVGREAWLGASPFKRFPEGPLKEYYRHVMRSMLTQETLDTLWGTGL